MKFRKPLKITSRTSSITNSFVQAIVPNVEPGVEEIDEALAILGMTRLTMECIYCGSKATDWDHLRPFVSGKKPTGYINDIRNMVPSCGPCNQSKIGADWRIWIEGTARGAPKTRGVTALSDRIARLERFVEWGRVKPLDLRALAGESLWDEYWARRDAIEQAMKDAQVHAIAVQEAIRKKLTMPDHPVTFGAGGPGIEAK